MTKNKTKTSLRTFLSLLALAPLFVMALPVCGESAEEKARTQEIAEKQAEIILATRRMEVGLVLLRTGSTRNTPYDEQLDNLRLDYEENEAKLEDTYERLLKSARKGSSEYKEIKSRRKAERKSLRDKYEADCASIEASIKDWNRIVDGWGYIMHEGKLLSELERLAISGKVDFDAKISYLKEKCSLKQILLLARLANPPELENNPVGGLGKALLTDGLGINLNLGLTSKQIDRLLEAMWFAEPRYLNLEADVRGQAEQHYLKAVVRSQVEQYYLKEKKCYECVSIENVQDSGAGKYVGKAFVRRITVEDGKLKLGKVRAADLNIDVFDKFREKIADAVSGVGELNADVLDKTVQVEVIDFDV